MPHPHPNLEQVASLADRRDMLKWAAMLTAAAGLAPAAVHAQATMQRTTQPTGNPTPQGVGDLRKGMLGFMLAHEQFPVPTLVQLGELASRSGFQLLATSDHLQPWQANEGHCGEAWVTMGSLSAHIPGSWIGTTVTCPTLRYNPAVVAEAFASLSLLHPGRVFLGVGSGEALNEQAATGTWPKWQERWDRLIEAITIIRQLWTGQHLSHKGTYYTVEAKLYDPPPHPIPLLIAANGKKSMRLAGQHGYGLITDPQTWKQHKPAWQDGARAAGKDPDKMPVLVEQYVVVGDEAEARKAAGLWRFGPKAFKTYYNIDDPTRIEQKADAEIPLDQVSKEWPIGTDPAVHIAAVRKLFDSGATIVNIPHGPDPHGPAEPGMIEFYASHILPEFRQPV